MANGSVKTNKFVQQMLNAHFKNSASPPSKMRIGIGTTTPTMSDTVLANKVPVKDFDVVDDFEATTGWSAGTDSAVTTNNITFKEGSFSLNLAKTGTSGSVASMSKTTTSLDFTSKDFWVWVYLTDKTDLVSSGTALTIRFGSDSSNYYYLDVDIDDLSNGWNYVSFNSSSATGTTGSPTITACDYTYLAVNTDNNSDTFTANRVMFDEAKLASSTDYDFEILASYPSVDEVGLSAETRAQLSLTQANGLSFTESGELDSSGNLHSHHVFDAETKDNTDIFYIVEKTKIRIQA